MLASFSNLKIAKLILRKVTILPQSKHFKFTFKKLEKEWVKCTTDANAMNCKFFLILKLWILWKSHFRDIYSPCLWFIGEIPRICVKAGLLPFLFAGWAAASGARSQRVTSFHLFLQLLPLTHDCSLLRASLFFFSALETGATVHFGKWQVGILPREVGISNASWPDLGPTGAASPRLRGRQDLCNED